MVKVFEIQQIVGLKADLKDRQKHCRGIDNRNSWCSKGGLEPVPTLETGVHKRKSLFNDIMQCQEEKTKQKQFLQGQKVIYIAMFLKKEPKIALNFSLNDIRV